MFVLALLAGTACAADRDISGHVVDRQGKPVAAVTVIGVHHLTGGGGDRRETTTDANGSFHLLGVGSVLAFRKGGYRPLTITLEETAPEAQVTLREDDTMWKMPSCGGRGQKGREYGVSVHLSVPSGAKAKRTVDADTWDYKITAPASETPYLLIWSGPGLCSKDPWHEPPWDEWIQSSAHWEERAMDAPGIDARGDLPNGHRWRYIRVRCDLIQYYDAPPYLAAYFDRVIETACIPAQTPR